MAIKRELLIGGTSVPARSGRTTEDLDPSTGAVYAIVAAAGPEDVTAAVDAAHDAFPLWAGLAPAARRDVLVKAADLLESRLEEYTAAMIAETGGTRNWARQNVFVTARNMREAATAATALAGHIPSTDRRQLSSPWSSRPAWSSASSRGTPR